MIIDNLFSRLFVFVADINVVLFPIVGIYCFFYFIFRRTRIRRMIESKETLSLGFVIFTILEMFIAVFLCFVLHLKLTGWNAETLIDYVQYGKYRIQLIQCIDKNNFILNILDKDNHLGSMERSFYFDEVTSACHNTNTSELDNLKNKFGYSLSSDSQLLLRQVLALK